VKTLKAEDLISRARIKFLLGDKKQDKTKSWPFLGTLALGLRVREGAGVGCKTMATDGRNLFYNQEFVESMTDEERLGVLAHEIGHVIYSHVLEWRRPSTKEFPEIFTMAQEYVVNDMVVNMFGLTLPGKPYYDKAYSGMYTEQVYRKLIKKLKPQKSKSFAAELGERMVDQHGLGAPGQGEEGKEGEEGSGVGSIWASDKEIEQLAKEIRLKVAQAANTARMKGSLPGGLEALIGEVLEPQVPWMQLLGQFITSITRDDFSWKTPNRRHLHQGVVLPSLHSEKIELAVAIDTSGSISKSDLADFMAELKGIMAACPSYTLHLFACDCDIHNYQELTPWDEIDIAGLLRGGGGTSFEPVLRKIEEEELQIAALIYLTDGYGDFGEEPPYPVLWCIKGGFTGVPYGHEVHL